MSLSRQLLDEGNREATKYYNANVNAVSNA